MGRRLTQRILECSICNTTPENGEHLWEMGNEVWCEKCCNEEKEENLKEFQQIIENAFNLGNSKK